MRTKEKHPNNIHRRILEEIGNHPLLKGNTLKETGIKIAKEFGRIKPFSRQYIEQVCIRWDGYNGFKHNQRKLTKNQIEQAMNYAGGKTTRPGMDYSVLNRLGIKKRGWDAVKDQGRERTNQIAILWNNTALSTAEITNRLGYKDANSLYSSIGRRRAKYPKINLIDRREKT